MGFKLNGVNSEGLPVDFIKVLQGARTIKYLIETGTAGGNSICEAAKLFEQCHTIELIEGRYTGEEIENVKFHIGDSVTLLPEIIESLDGFYALFFLDAHYSDPEPNTTDIPECPVLYEIKAISVYENALIIIDDARLFLGAPPYPLDPRQWPGIVQVFEALKEAFPLHYITLLDDYVLAVPTHFHGAVEREWLDRFYIRYPSAKDKLKTEVKNVYDAFKNYVSG